VAGAFSARPRAAGSDSAATTYSGEVDRVAKISDAIDLMYAVSIERLADALEPLMSYLPRA
jgi:hypothetical protein